MKKIILSLLFFSLLPIHSIVEAQWFNNFYQTIQNNKSLITATAATIVGGVLLYNLYKYFGTPKNRQEKLPITNVNLNDHNSNPTIMSEIIDVDEMIVQEIKARAETENKKPVIDQIAHVDVQQEIIRQPEPTIDTGAGVGPIKIAKRRKKVQFLSNSHINNAQEISRYSKTFQDLINYLDQRITDINNRLQRINTRQNQEVEYGFELIGQPTESEYTSTIKKLVNKISNEFKIITNNEFKAQYKKEINQYIDKLITLQNSVAITQLRITSEPKALYNCFKKGLSNLTDVGINIKEAYEILRFNKNDRDSISVEDINTAVLKLSSESSEQRVKQIRQAGFTLNNQFGKLLYDAFLSSPQHMEMLAISPEDVEEFDLDHMAITNEISTYNNYISQLLKQLNKH